MLYERAYELLEHREHIRALRTQFKANFERDAALIRRRVNFPALNGIRQIRITIRSTLSGQVHVAMFNPDTTYGTFFSDVRRLFNQPTHNTSVSMRLWHEANPRWLVEGRSDCRLGIDMHNTTLCCTFYRPQPADESESDSSETPPSLEYTRELLLRA